MGTGGNNVPLTLKIRAGCEGGGKGCLLYTSQRYIELVGSDEEVCVERNGEVIKHSQLDLTGK